MTEVQKDRHDQVAPKSGVFEVRTTGVDQIFTIGLN